VNRTKAILLVGLLVVVVAAGLAIEFLPKHYSVGQSLPQAWAFWGKNDAFIFLGLNTTGRSRNVLQEKLAAARYGYWTLMFGGYFDFAKQDVVAYHLSANGQLDRFDLPPHTAITGTWSLEDGHLQLAPMAGVSREVQGFRWDGTKFVPISPTAPPSAGSKVGSRATVITADDDDEDSSRGYGGLTESARRQFKAAGWHHKLLAEYVDGSAAEVTLPLQVGANTFSLTLENDSIDRNSFANFDFMMYGVRSLKLSGHRLARGEQALWTRAGWQAISKADYERMKGESVTNPGLASRYTWVWLLVAALLFVLKFWSWGHVLFRFGSVKQRIVKNMATSFSFPPAAPSQFPLLDLDGLERYTRELEGMGFARLLDFSLITNSPIYPPSFCRLFAHTRHHCFALVNQLFPRGKVPMPVKCSLESQLQGGWSIAFGDRRPQAAASLVRRRRVIGVNMPEAHLPELLTAMLKMRDQMCVDLGISPLNDDTLEAYISKTQRSAGELRDAVQEKNFVKGLSEVYLRRFSLLRTKPEYVWLGDYPKEAERRKQGLGTFSTSTG
jgi:hypothetical protein